MTFFQKSPLFLLFGALLGLFFNTELLGMMDSHKITKEEAIDQQNFLSAINDNNTETATLLLYKYKESTSFLNTVNKNKEHILQLAIAKSMTSPALTLVDNPYLEANWIDAAGKTFLHMAIDQELPEVAHGLLKKHFGLCGKKTLHKKDLCHI
jgi:hypothetical protein